MLGFALSVLLMSPVLMADNSQEARIKTLDYIKKHRLSPDPMNEKTIDQQNSIVKSIDQEVQKFLETKDISIEKNRIELFELWSSASDFDFNHAIAKNNSHLLKNHHDILQKQILDLLKQKKGSVSKKHLKQIQMTLAMAEDEIKNSTPARK
jgi:hypothetical protein